VAWWERRALDGVLEEGGRKGGCLSFGFGFGKGRFEVDDGRVH